MDETDLPDKTDIDWLDAAIMLANTIVAHILIQINGRMAESGKALVLKTSDASKAHVGSNPTSSAIEE